MYHNAFKVHLHWSIYQYLNSFLWQVIFHSMDVPHELLFLKEIGISDHLTCLLRNLYLSQEATVRTRHGTMGWFKIGKGVCQGYLSPCLFNLNAEYINQNARLDESQAGNKTARRNVNNLRYADDTTLNGTKQRRTKKPLDEGEKGEWKSWLKTQHSKN